jgi:hypothetical protein
MRRSMVVKHSCSSIPVLHPPVCATIACLTMADALSLPTLPSSSQLRRLRAAANRSKLLERVSKAESLERVTSQLAMLTTSIDSMLSVFVTSMSNFQSHMPMMNNDYFEVKPAQADPWLLSDPWSNAVGPTPAFVSNAAGSDAWRLWHPAHEQPAAPESAGAEPSKWTRPMTEDELQQEDDLLQQEAHELEEMEQQLDDEVMKEEEDTEVLNTFAEEDTEVLTTYAVGDYVELHNLKDNALNGQKGTVIDKLPNGRIRVRLGPHLMARNVSARAGNVRMVHARATIEEIQKCRDQGQSVRSLLADGFSVGAIQRDDSEKLCSDCCRPRVMCSCTYGIKE